MLQAILRGFSSAVRYRVGQRVLVDLDATMADLCRLPGTIIAARAKFPSTPKMRQISYQVQFDKPPFPEPMIGSPGMHQRLWVAQDHVRSRVRRTGIV